MFRRLTKAKHHRTLILWLLIAVFVVPLLFFFHGGFGSVGRESSVAGTIYGRPVSWQVFQDESHLIRRSMEQQLGGQLAEVFEPYVQQQTWDRLLLKAEARRHIKISDRELADFIQHEPTFQQHGRFDRALYARFVQASGTSPRLFEERIREDLQVARLLEAIKAQVRLSDDDLRQAYAKDFNRLRAVLVVVDPTQLESQLTPLLTPDLLRAAYERYPEAVRIPARRTFDYIGLTIEEARSHVTPVTENDIRTAYDSRRQELTDNDGAVRPFEQVRESLRGDLREDRARRMIRELTLDLQDDIDAKRTLQEMAIAHTLTMHPLGPYDAAASHLPAWFTPLMLKAAFEVPIGETTEAFSTPTSVYVLQPREETPARLPPFEEVKGRAEQLALEALGRDAAAARATQLQAELTALQAGGLRMEESLAVLGLEPKRPAPFTRAGLIESLGPLPDVAQRLFELEPGRWSEAIDTPRGWVIGFVEEIIPFDEAQFQKDAVLFRDKALTLKQQERLSTWIEQLRTQAHLTSFLDQTK